MNKKAPIEVGAVKNNLAKINERFSIIFLFIF